MLEGNLEIIEIKFPLVNQVYSIGLGGGSIVRKTKDSPMTIGPDSVGYQIQSKALVFGGDISTTTDYTVATDEDIVVGNPAHVRGIVPADHILEFQQLVKTMLEKVVDTMKTSPEDIPVLLVGGGAIIAPDELKGASKVLKPKWSGVANAIGAAIARVSAVIDTVESTESKTIDELFQEVSLRVIEKAVEGGAARESVQIVEMESLPLQVMNFPSRARYQFANNF
jgi:N-methylhydantoinase A/oxoprolinase/acetone carboxylase beta subunit